jgi:ABC-type glycerol-3-phosphate transport system substrate-binding protein
MQIKTRLATVCLLLLAVSLAFGAGTTEPAAPAAEKVVELRVWFGRKDFIPADNFKAFHEQYPNIRVVADVIPLESAVADTLRAARAGQAPDIVQTFNYDSQPLADSGQILDITKLLERWKAEDPQGYASIAPWGFEMGKVGGIPSGLGVHGGSRYLIYRKDILAKYNLKVPETWDDLIEASRVIVAREPGMYGMTLFGSRGSNPSTELQIFFGMGGVWPNQGVPQIDSPAGRYLIQVYQTLTRERLIHPETIAWSSGNQRSAFLEGRAAFLFEGENIMPAIASVLKYGEQWDVAAPPHRPGARAERTIPVIGFPYYIGSQTKHPYEASLVLRYLARADIVKEVALRYQPTSTTTAMNAPDFLAAQPWRPALAGSANELFPYPAMRNAEASFDILKDLRDEMFKNVTESPASIAARYQARLNQAASR